MRLFIIVPLLFLSMLGKSQDLSKLNAAIQSGEAEQIQSFLAEKIDLEIEGKTKRLSAVEAAKSLERFFTDNEGLIYESKHQGGQKTKTQFTIGTLSNASKKFRSHILYKTVNNQAQIIELRFELED